MTGLTSDLSAITARYSNLPDDVAVPIPVGAVRAAARMLKRYEGWPLVDRVTEVHVVPQVSRQKRNA